MTLIVGWKDKKNAYLIGDSAVTRRNIPIQEFEQSFQRRVITTSFGESLAISPERVITEEVIKIHNLKNRIAIAYVGTGDIALDMISHIEDEMGSDYRIHELIDVVKEGARRYGRDYELLIALMAGKEPVLYSFNRNGSGKHEFYNEYTPVLLGNLRNEVAIKTISASLMNMFRYGVVGVSYERRLVMACSLFQGVVIRAGFIAEGVGGFFTGASVSRRGFRWLRDIAYITFGINEEAIGTTWNPQVIYPNAQLVILLNRENRIAMAALEMGGGYRNIRFFQNYINSNILRINYEDYEADFASWLEEYQAELIDCIANYNLDYMIFMCIDTNTWNKLTIIGRKDIENRVYVRPDWVNGIPSLSFSSWFSQQINPLTAKYVNEFSWL